MKKILSLGLALALTLTALVGCSNSSKKNTKTPEELKTLYATAITEKGGEMVQYNPVMSEIKEEDGSAFMLSEMFGLAAEDVTALGMSVSMMNVKAYGIAAMMPAEGKEEAVKAGLQKFIDTQKSVFEFYLADQYEVAKAAKLEKLADGTILMVMCENSDTVFADIKAAIEA